MLSPSHVVLITTSPIRTFPSDVCVSSSLRVGLLETSCSVACGLGVGASSSVQDEIRTYYEVHRLKGEGVSIAATARQLGIRPQRVYKALGTDISRLLSADQTQAMKAAREMAGIISGGCITPSIVAKRLEGKASTRIVCRCMRSVCERYKLLREEVRNHNRALGEQRKSFRVKASTIWHYIVTGETSSRKLLKLHETHPEVEPAIRVCIRFRKMLHDEDDAPGMDEWLREAGACQLKEIRGFADYIRKDRKAVELACQSAFSNGLLEGTVNKAKAIKRSMFNRAKPEVLRAKMIYGGLKCDWNYHPN